MKGLISMKSWLIQFENKINKTRMTIYDNGLVYGTGRNEKLFILSRSSIEQLKDIINENMYMFKTLEYQSDGRSPIVLRVNDTSRKHRNIKICVWGKIERLLNIIMDENNHIKNFY